MMRKTYILLFLCLALSCAARAQQFPFRHLEMSDGLSNNRVTSIYKDSRGFVWFGTAVGLNRYDGYGIRVYYNKYADETSLPNSNILRMQEDADGHLWIKTGWGYAVYDAATDTFDRNMNARMKQWGIDGVPSLIYIDKDFSFWIWVEGKGIFYRKSGEGSARMVEGSQELLAASQMTDMTGCQEGVLLVQRSGKLSCIESEPLRIKWTRHDISQEKLVDWDTGFSLFVDNGSKYVWVYSHSGTFVCRLSQQEWHMRKLTSVEGDVVCAIAQDVQGRIWIGRDQTGIEVVDPSGESIFLTHDPTSPHSLPHNTIRSIYVDNEGIVWVGTFKKGVSCYNESIYKFGLNHITDINCILEDKEDCFWLGTNGEGLLYWNRKTGEKKTIHHMQTDNHMFSEAITSLLKDSKNRLWMGTFRKGLYRYENGQFTHYMPDGSENALSNENVWALAEDREGNIWIGTFGDGLQCLNPQTGRFTTYSPNIGTEGLGTSQITSLCMGQNNILFIGTTYGFSSMDLKTRQITRFMGAKNGGEGLSTHVINQIYEDSRGLVWIAENEGLYVYDPKQNVVHEVSLYTGLPYLMVQGIAEDNDHTLWVTTSNQLINVIPVLDSKTGELSFQQYLFDHRDGLQNCDFNQRSLVRLSSGELMLGGLYGLNYFYPHRLRYNQVLPKVMFTDFQLFTESVKVGAEYDGQTVLKQSLNEVDEVELRYRQNVFTVFFASDNYVHPEKTRYSYRLEGFTDQWTEAAPGVNWVTYTNLAPGKYTLCVKATNSDGFQGTEEARLHIVILPPFWRTTWAYLFYTLLSLGIVVLAYYAANQRMHNKYRLRQQEENARKQEELNQLKFRFFTNVSHELRTPLTLIITPLESILKESKEKGLKEKLEVMHRNAQRLLTLVNQLLDFRKNEMAVLHLSLSEGDIVAYLRSICNSYLLLSENKNVHLTFFSAVERLHMPFDEDKIGKIVMNLLSNAFKFTPDGGRVDVALVLPPERPDHLQIRVSDTGVGISDEEKEHVFERFYQVRQSNGSQTSTGSGIGLSLVRDFVTLHEGTVTVMDNVGGIGSVFVVEIPISKRNEEGVAEKHAALTETASAGEKEADAKDNSIPEEVERHKPLALLVDDNEDLLKLMGSSLKLYFRIASATNGRLAMEQLERCRPDIIVCDIMMPVMDGNELCRRVKGNEETADIPIILLTAKHSVDDKLEGLTQGADEYMTKPFNMEILTLRMQKLISLSKKKSVKTRIDPEPHEITITSRDEKLIEDAIRYVEQHMDDSELSVEEMSRALGMSRARLYLKMSQVTGKTPSEFIRVIRLKRAAQLLRESQQTVAEVAYQVGFSNPKYFSRYFRDEFGILPSVYQESEGKSSSHQPSASR